MNMGLPGLLGAGDMLVDRTATPTPLGSKCFVLLKRVMEQLMECGKL